MPSFAHRAIKELVEKGYATHVTTSNHDGLVHKTGLDEDKITEMFGSSYVEICLSCKTKFRRSTAVPPLNRKCELCQGKLNKKGCRYGQAIETDKLERGKAEAKNSDISICLGSGMHTWPFTLDGFCGKAKLCVIVNLGRTPVDGFPQVQKFDMECDEFMKLLCGELGVEVPSFTFEQKCKVYWKWENDAKTSVLVGLDSFLPNEAVTFNKDEVFVTWGNGNSKVIDRDGFRWSFNESLFPISDKDEICFSISPKDEYDISEDIKINLIVDSSVDSGYEIVVFKTKPM